ncbi:hypothetical protein ASG22_16095 [Chryseobacterium sp. Leaf405]|uniref:hypothetical protein n=1 Tax=Chryseobacterium sp. Leaf405 TaxID=1736367 RepID=UPI0006FF113E|nr:hypothetical protein [Chryseobacterium sp. Leaf405]KQT20939.1 hypothetical protein ASG22_16095 [Chryseobacterium sp. Leaf405]
MEGNEITTREKLKTYFETGKYPTEDQFAELIDYLRLKEDVLTNKEMVALSNSLASIDNGYIEYNIINTGDLKFPIVISSNDEEDQMLAISKRYDREEKRYFYGNAPYSIRTKEFPAEGLGENEYYFLNSQIDGTFGMNRLFGNNLDTVPDGFELGMVEDKKFYLQISKQNFEQQINILHTGFTFVNKTEISIQYAIYGNFWSNAYTSKDIITDHYDLWDSLACMYRADLTEINKSIECRVYDADGGGLLMTAHLLPGQKNQNVWAGNVIEKLRNIKIVCDYASEAK